MQQEQTDKFVAQSDDGESYIIVEYTTMIPFKPVSGPETWARGSRSFITSAGRDINEIDNDHFEDVLTGKVFKRIRTS